MQGILNFRPIPSGSFSAPAPNEAECGASHELRTASRPVAAPLPSLPALGQSLRVWGRCHEHYLCRRRRPQPPREHKSCPRAPSRPPSARATRSPSAPLARSPARPPSSARPVTLASRSQSRGRLSPSAHPLLGGRGAGDWQG